MSSLIKAKQLSIEMALDIPARDLKLFRICNQASKHWYNKPAFYQFKSSLLTKYGHENGYDLQIIERVCFNCSGSGIHWNKEPCWQCNKGIHHTSYVLLKRYLLNGEVFHCPHLSTNDKWTGPINKNTIYREFEYKNIIIGLIKHEPSEYNLEVAIVELYLKYDTEQLYRYLEFWSKGLRTKALHKWKKSLRKYGISVKSIAEYFGVKKDIDELPF